MKQITPFIFLIFQLKMASLYDHKNSFPQLFSCKCPHLFIRQFEFISQPDTEVFLMGTLRQLQGVAQYYTTGYAWACGRT